MTSRFVNSRLLQALLLSTSFSFIASAGKPAVETAEKPLTAKEVSKARLEYNDDQTELIKIQQIPGDKKSFSIRRGDGKLSLGGRAAQEYYFYKNPMLLNNALPDEYGFFKTTADIFIQTYWGKKKYDHKAVEAYMCLRHKSEWGGQFGKNTGVDGGAVQVSQTSFAGHKHPSTKPLMWLKDAWVKLSGNAIFGLKNENRHFVKLGFFPFQLGRGIAFGQGYGTPGKDFLGIYNRYNDFSAPGILFTGSLLKDILEYDLYYAKYDEKGVSSGQTFASTRNNHVGMRTTPFRGVGKDDEAWAMQLRWTAANSKKYGTIDINPYIFVNEGSDRKVEFESDAKSRLGSGGVQIEYAHPRFEIGGECAFNFGFEQLYNIDRNVVKMQNDDNGNVQEVYTHVLQTSLPKPLKPVYVGAPATKTIKAMIIGDNQQKGNSEILQSVGSIEYSNKGDRYRPAYRNEYRGWMVVADMSLIVPEFNWRISTGAGIASGDKNPHAEEKNKVYKGFVGLHEFYTGQRVQSIFFLDGRTIKRPLTLDGGRNATVDTSFSDLAYLGFGTTWNPRFGVHRLSASSNAMFFFKHSPSQKYDLSIGNKGAIVKDSFASNYLGYELNLITEYTIFTDLKITAKVAAFMPGTYYSDIKGAPLPDDAMKVLEESDLANLDTSNYTISDHTAYFFNLRLSYQF
jgi:hypothetical protein